MKYYYDLHIHSCLSPCGDNDSTPDSIAGMGELNGLSIMALTDHNTCKNCAAFFKAAEHHGVIAVAGMELTTSEEIHVVCLFETLQEALLFDCEIQKRRIQIANKPNIFGDQLIINDIDEVTGIEPDLLITATNVSISEVKELVDGFGGVCFPAHVDRESNGVIAILGSFPKELEFAVVEIHDREKIAEYSKICNIPPENFLISSDAHNLWSIKERVDTVELFPENDSADAVRRSLIEYLRRKK